MRLQRLLIPVCRIGLLLIGSVLIVDSLVLWSMDKINVGTIVPCLIGAVMVLQASRWQWLGKQGQRYPRLARLWRLGWWLFGLWLISFGVFVWQLKRTMYHNATVPPVQAIVVLGSGSKDGKPTPTLQQRLDAAAVIANAQPTAVVIVSGGKDSGETVSEAEAMARYLVATHQLPDKQIEQEDRSTSTELNFSYSKPLLGQRGVALSAPIAVVTSDFHTQRSAAIARKQGYQQVIMVGSPTPLSIRYNAWLREYFAYISGWLLQEY